MEGKVVDTTTTAAGAVSEVVNERCTVIIESSFIELIVSRAVCSITAFDNTVSSAGFTGGDFVVDQYKSDLFANLNTMFGPSIAVHRNRFHQCICLHIIRSTCAFDRVSETTTSNTIGLDKHPLSL